MRILTFETDVYDVTTEQKWAGGVDYVIPRELISHFASASDGHMSVLPYVIPKPFDPNGNWDRKRILVHRSGSAGDLLFITPLLREIKRRWPHCWIAFHCEPRYYWVLENNPHVDQVVAPLLTLDFVNSFDAQIDLESASEFSPLAKTHVLTDVYASVAGIDLADNRTVYAPPPEVLERVALRYPRAASKRVGISLASDGLIRNYPFKLNLEVISALMHRGIQVVLLGKMKTGVNRTPLFIDLAGERPELTWEESTAFMKTCDLVLGPDSSAIHFAGAMGVPSLGLYGPFLASLRIPPQPATQAIQGTGTCAPCFHHGRGNAPFPPNGPCKLTGQCEVLASIPPQQVVAKILEMIDMPHSSENVAVSDYSKAV